MPLSSQQNQSQDLTGSKLGNYRLEKVLGRGSMGVVYLAQDEALLRPTAVKVLAWSMNETHGQDPVKWFLEEARNVARVSHPRVVQVYNVAKAGEQLYIAMEYVEGESASRLVAREGRLSASRATEVLCQAADALHAAHACGVIHRDVKPANLLVTADGIAKLSDFGMALSPAAQVTAAANLRVGTPYYTAPEVWHGQSATPQSDIYSLGGTYFFLLTGRPPYVAQDLAGLEEQHRENPVPDPRDLYPDLPGSCHQIIQRCMAKKAADRYGSAQELGWEARGLLRSLEVSPRPAQAAVLSVPSADFTRHSDVIETSFAPASRLFSQTFGFRVQPFADVNVRKCPYTKEPFDTVGSRLIQILSEQPGSLVVVAGGPGSGRTVLCRSGSMQLSKTRLVLYLELAGYRGPARLLQRLCRAAGAVPDVSGGADGVLKALVDRLEQVQLSHGKPSVLVLDGVTLTADLGQELGMLVRAASATKFFSVLVVGPVGLLEQIANSGQLRSTEMHTELRLPALTATQTMSYIDEWIRASIDPAVLPIIVPPDAALIVHARAQGVLSTINHIATNMLVVAAQQQRRVLTSWDAWAAASTETWPTEPTFRPELPPKPEVWPTPEALEMINTERAGIGWKLRE